MGNETIQITYFDIDERIEKTISCDLTSLCESQESARSRNKTNHTEIVKTTEFQLIDIPNALRNHGIKHIGHAWEKAAKMQELWFSLPAREMTSDEKSGKSLTIPQENILSDYYALEWLEEISTSNILSDGINTLLNEGFQLINGEEFVDAPSCIYNKSARTVLFNIFNNLPELLNHNDTFNIKNEKGMMYFHNKLQFQFVSLLSNENNITDHIKLICYGNPIKDEFFATVAGCQLNAAIGKYTIEKDRFIIKSVYLYLRDTFDFRDTKQDQYLGHWNRNGFDVFYKYVLNGTNEIIDLNKILFYEPNDVQIEPIEYIAAKYKEIFKENHILMPVRNSSYNNWREKHNKGGDLLIFSELKEYPCHIIVERVNL